MKHTLMKLGAGIGLMAASATALAGGFAGGAGVGLHGFGSSMVYAKAAGATPVYTSFTPSGNQGTDSVILLELTQGTGTVPGTWQYFISSQPLSTALGGMVYSLGQLGSTSGNTGWVFSVSATSAAVGQMLPSGGVSTAATFWGPIGNGSTTGGPGAAVTSNGEIDIGFSFSTSLSASASATCNVSFNAYVGTDDYMQYWIAAISASNVLANLDTTYFNSGIFSGASTGAWTMTTKSAGTTSDTATGSFSTLGTYAGGVSTNNFNQIFFPSASGTSYARTSGFTYASVQVVNSTASSTGTFTLGSAPMKQIAACQALGNTRLALNSLGLAVGGKVGMLRIW